MIKKSEVLSYLDGYLNLLKNSGVQFIPKASQTVYELNFKKNEINSTVAKTEIEIAEAAETLVSIRDNLGQCNRCMLSSSRNQIVFGVGNPNADLVFVGEAPGRDEDIQGEPFVGKAGQLLTKIIQAINLEREQVYICNVIKCRPPENRNPLPEEIEACHPFLLRQLQSIKPKVICALGKFAAQMLLQTETPISRLRGHFHDYHGIPLMPTYHPAFLLRNPEKKRDVWNDIQMVQKKLGI